MGNATTYATHTLYNDYIGKAMSEPTNPIIPKTPSPSPDKGTSSEEYLPWIQWINKLHPPNEPKSYDDTFRPIAEPNPIFIEPIDQYGHPASFYRSPFPTKFFKATSKYKGIVDYLLGTPEAKAKLKYCVPTTPRRKTKITPKKHAMSSGLHRSNASTQASLFKTLPHPPTSRLPRYTSTPTLSSQPPKLSI